MRKLNYLFGALALGVGVLVGTVGVSLMTNSSSPVSFISKLRGQDKIQTVSGTVSGPLATPPSTEPPQVGLDDSGTEDEKLAQQVIADYKQDIGIFFGAWKSTDMETFRQRLAKAYTGDLFEKHAHRAEEYLVQGIGLEVSKIVFDQVDVESVSENAATLRVDYRYTARDYNLTDRTAVGEEHEQIVQARVNLVKQNSRWLITGESTIQ
ncbi:hypothetical protein Desor_5342 [Desulfosporosinus orientis DSM 765]|uniref:Tim44-like domain-containing protein n=1 Tax=Desulfosporosinus orientis (strain ATCC 19365 / DSM 765 / NCIMB 8382 / VKM B-1628 / Singapore I) TaxID=768706 RepID=G7WCA2_DESOD|nr:hypothetical protein [Desulfosporosinus orientis]AET70720.1 hypothetical protein Desor_5342 [Desulfosporosinus orientis DSM 765]